jgi:hypothetical protein
MNIFEMIENEAIETFGADKIGTRELRVALPEEEKAELLEFLFRRFGDITGIYVKVYV